MGVVAECACFSWSITYHMPASVRAHQVWQAFMDHFGRLRQQDGSIELLPEALTQVRLLGGVGPNTTCLLFRSRLG